MTAKSTFHTIGTALNRAQTTRAPVAFTNGWGHLHGEHLLNKRVAAAVATAVLAVLPPSPAAAERPRADLTPGCVDADEYNRTIRRLDTKSEVEKHLKQRGHRALILGEYDLFTGQPYPTRSKTYAKFYYPGCTGDMYLIYVMPSRGHKGAARWVYANYIEF